MRQSIKEIHNQLEKKEISATEITRSYLDNINRLEPKIEAFITITEDLAIEQAKKVDEKISKGEKLKPLEGIPGAIKDNILVEGIKCTSASKILENVKDFTGTSHTLRIDLYRFYYYYLTSENLKSILIKPSYLLIEWQSIYYADFNQINNITDSVLKKNTIEALYTNGINYAWNTSILETSINNAFYNLNSDGTISLDPNHLIIKNNMNQLACFLKLGLNHFSKIRFFRKRA